MKRDRFPRTTRPTRFSSTQAARRRAASFAPLLALALLFNGAFPATRALAATTTRAAQEDTPQEALERKSDPKLRMTYRAVNIARADKTVRAAGKGTRQALAAKISHLVEAAGVAVTDEGAVNVRVMVDLTEASAEELKRAGFRVGAIVGDIAAVETEAAQLPRLAALKSVEKLSAINYAQPTAWRNDEARKSVGVDNSAGARALAQTGKGVVVGVIDSGIDFRHPDFMVPGTDNKKTRIKAILDVTTYVDANKDGKDDNWDYTPPGGTAPVGKLYTEAQINASIAAGNLPQDQDTVKERDKNGHGTHVAGSAVGNGLGGSTQGRHAGMAPEADIVIVKASRANDKSGGFADDDQLSALEFIRHQAATLNQPFVINMSLGGHTGPHDGTDMVEKAIDNLVAGGAGRVVCVAAGNEGEQKLHASGQLAQGAQHVLNLTVPAGDSAFMNLYYPGADRFSVEITQPDGAKFGPYQFDQTDDKPGFQVENKSVRDGLNTVSVQMVQKNFTSRNWTFTLRGETVSAGGRFDAWTGDHGDFGAGADPSMRVGTPATSRGAITVGAYVTRLAPNDTASLGDAGAFSSPGPTRDNRDKPEISAPGAFLYSSKSADAAPDNSFPAPPDGSTFHVGQQGTSMATPVTAGAIALLLQAKPTLTSDQIKELLKQTSNKDAFLGGKMWHERLGFGKLNIAAAIAAVTTPTPTPTPSPSPTATPTPTPTPTATPTPTPTPTATPTPTPTPVATPTPTPAPTASVQFGEATYAAGEGSGAATITVTRAGDTSAALTVEYATANGTASERSDYTAARGTLRFAAGEAAKTFGVMLTDDLSVEAAETVALSLSNPAGGSMGARASATLTINDNDTTPSGANPADDASFFVRQHYLDFLNREPDAPGLAFWSGQITQCGTNAACVDARRTSVSQAFFLSTEFQNTGYFVIRMHRAAYGNQPGVPRLPRFLADAQEVGRGVVVGQAGWPELLEANKRAFAETFVLSADFTQGYPANMTAQQYVDALFLNAGATSPSQDERQAAVNAFGAGDAAGRAAALRSVIESGAVYLALYNPAVVQMQYFGYLRRNADDAPDGNFGGYNFWLAKMNQFSLPGEDMRQEEAGRARLIRAEMVRAFIISTEYRDRFKQP